AVRPDQRRERVAVSGPRPLEQFGRHGSPPSSSSAPVLTPPAARTGRSRRDQFPAVAVSVLLQAHKGHSRAERGTMSTQEFTIADRTVLVTGANRGIGRALVDEALRAGARRVYAGTRKPLTHPDGRVTPLILDVTDAAQIRAAVERVDALDVLVNNAGL